jgi:photosystem II stability/assembly factor-like uncharacterized protein
MKRLNTVFLLLFISQISFTQWTEQNSGVTAHLRSVSAIDNYNVWISGQSVVLSTTNGGLNWILLPSNGILCPTDLTNIFALNSSIAFVISNDSYPPSHKVYRTTDGGYNWTVVLSFPDRFIDAIWMINQNQGILVGDPPQFGGEYILMKTSDGGVSWSNCGTLYGQSLETGFVNSLYVIGNNVWFGTSSRVIYSTNFGNSWALQQTDMHTYALFFLNASTGMLGGWSGSYQDLKFTTNSGLNWSYITDPGSNDVGGLANNSLVWWCAKFNGKIYKSSNNGVNWAEDYNSNSYNIRHMSKARNGSRIWAVGSSGFIVMSEGIIGISKISNEIAYDFSLSQNYPNPFNPVTKIKFSLPNPSEGGAIFVRLVVYDLLGREIANLIPPLLGGQEGLKPGSYEGEWDGSNFTSGVYFYRLVTADYSETKKMILLK